MGDVNPHAQCLKLSKGEKNGSKTKLNSCFHVLQDGLFTSCYAFSEAAVSETGNSNNYSSESWVLRSWVLWTCILLEHFGVCTTKTNERYYPDKHIMLW